MDYQEQIALVDEYTGKTLPAIVIEYAPSGEPYEGDMLFCRRSAALGVGYPYAVTVPLKPEKISDGVPVEDAVVLEIYLPTLDDAKVFVEWYIAHSDVRWAKIMRIMPNLDVVWTRFGYRTPKTYGHMAFVGLVTLDEPVRAFFCDE